MQFLYVIFICNFKNALSRIWRILRIAQQKKLPCLPALPRSPSPAPSPDAPTMHRSVTLHVKSGKFEICEPKFRKTKHFAKQNSGYRLYHARMHGGRITRKCALFRTEFTVCVPPAFAIWPVQNEVSARGSLLRKWPYIGNPWVWFLN